MRIFTAILCSLTLWSTSAFAQTISGQDDPRFESAVVAWLDGDNSTALPEFSELANSGNAAAQLFLGSLEQYTYLHHDYTSALDRKERIQLLRDDKGVSGRSWLKVLAPELPLAQGLLDARQIGAREEGIGVLYEAFHHRQILENLEAVVENGNHNFALNVALAPDLKPIAGPLAVEILHWAEIQGAPADQLDQLAAIIQADPQISDAAIASWSRVKSYYDKLVSTTDGVEAAMAALPELAPAKRLCEAQCPSEVPTCVADMNHFSNQPISFTSMSPAETLISTEAYRASKRIDRDFRTYLKTSVMMLPPEKRLSQCDYGSLFLSAQ